MNTSRLQPQTDVDQHDLRSNHQPIASEQPDDQSRESADSDSEVSPGDREEMVSAEDAHHDVFSSSSDELCLLRSARAHLSQIDTPRASPLSVKLTEAARLASTLCESEMPQNLRRHYEDAFTITRVEARSIHQHNRHTDCSPYKTGKHSQSAVHTEYGKSFRMCRCCWGSRSHFKRASSTSDQSTRGHATPDAGYDGSTTWWEDELLVLLQQLEYGQSKGGSISAMHTM